MTDLITQHLANLAAEHETVPAWLQQAIKEVRIAGTEAVAANELYLPLARYYLSHGDIRQMRAHLHWLHVHVAADKSAGTTAANQRAQALLLAAEGKWAAASSALEQVVERKVFSPYEQANALTEYSFMLQTRAEQEYKPSLQAEAKARRLEAAAMFLQVGLAQREAQVVSWLRRVYRR